MPELHKEQLQKTHLFFGFEDILVPGQVNRDISPVKVRLALEKLRILEDQGVLNFYLISSYTQKLALRKVADSGLKDFFKRQSVYCVTPGYVNRKSDVDKERYKEQLAQNIEFKDEFLKQKTFERFIKKGIPAERLVFIGHDLLTDAYYTRRFSHIDFAMIEKSLSYHHVRVEQKVPGLAYIDMDWDDLKRLITGKIPKPDYSGLDKFVYLKLRNELFKDVPPVKVGK